MHLLFVADRFGEFLEKTFHQLFAGLGFGGHHVIARDAPRLEVPDAATDQVELVGEVVVQDRVREIGFLRDLAQAGLRVAEFAGRFQRSFRQFDAPRFVSAKGGARQSRDRAKPLSVRGHDQMASSQHLYEARREKSHECACEGRGEFAAVMR